MFKEERDQSQLEWSMLGDLNNVSTLLRIHGVNLRVIALSAQDDEITRNQARQAGAVAFCRKPVDDQALLDAIHWVMTSAPH